MKQDWLKDFKLSKLLSAEEQILLYQSVHYKKLSPGEYVFQDGQACHHVVLVKNGCIRVQKLSADGHMLTLGRLGKFRCCELSVSSAISGKPYPAEAIAEKDSSLILIPSNTVKQLMFSSEQWQSFLFHEIGRHLNELILLAEDVAFLPIERRLARRLIDGADKEMKLKETHSDIAADLGSAREVVSRTLKRFENSGYLCLHRGWIEIKNPSALNNIFH
ncbi:MAG: Crp/Fnr family transcriptional regulator [Gammaproteobacteria bacterium]|nr:Crp/Fnr family transcriptional regulator [Gammaproteobacteria bacterium]